MRDIHISIVSHNQQKLVSDLLYDIGFSASSSRYQITITHNVPEKKAASYLDSPFPIRIINNTFPKGFSANHNYAFKSSLLPDQQQYFIVINPDVRLNEDTITQLVSKLKENEKIGITAPTVLGLNKTLEDSARELPTPSRIIAKIFGNNSIWNLNNNNQPDWVAGMFMAFKSNVFKEINGFDEDYFLYYEDVDICSRLWLKGYSIQVVRDASIIHDAQRASRRDFRYLRWHISSMLRFFSSSTYRKIKTFHQQRIKST